MRMIEIEGAVDGGDCAPSASDVEAQLARILASETFGSTPRRREFLKYVVGESLAGRTDQLKGVAIAIAVFGRDETFDQQLDPIVRVEARRLRQDINTYYASAGRDDPIRISIPKGGYAPHFERNDARRRSWHTEPTHAEPLESEPAPAPDTPPSAGADRRLIWGAVASVAIAVIAIVFGVWSYQQRHRALPAPSAPIEASTLALPGGPSVVILPFVNLSGDPGKSHVAVGITQQLATEFVRFRNLRVFALGATSVYKEGLADPQKLRTKLDVAYVIEGSVRANDETIRITARLIDTETAQYVWSANYDKPLTPQNIYTVQDEIIQEVTGAIAGNYGVMALVSINRATRVAPDSIAAYDCVLRYYDYQTTIDPGRHDAIKVCLENAVKLEPKFAEAWAVLANIYMQEKRFRFGAAIASDVSMANARTAIDHAIALDPLESTGYLMLSTWYFTMGDLDKFREAGERALSLNPNASDLLAHYGMRLASVGDDKRGLALVERAIKINPGHPTWYHFPKVLILLQHGQYADAMRILEKVHMPRFFWTYLLRAALYGHLGQQEQAREAAKELYAILPNFSRDSGELVSMWQMNDTLKTQLFDGLRKAGVDIKS